MTAGVQHVLSPGRLVISVAGIESASFLAGWLKDAGHLGVWVELFSENILKFYEDLTSKSFPKKPDNDLGKFFVRSLLVNVCRNCAFLQKLLGC